MFENLDEVKVFRDPIHEYIRVDKRIVWDVINTKEFQRMRRIKQLGGTFMVYHTAEHSRFAHSLGVYEIARRMIDEIVGLSDLLSERDKIVLLISALVHDVGHGPFSHAFEAISLKNHEFYTKKIILGNTEINQVLNSYDPLLANDVVAVIDHKYPNKILTDLVSSQIDADRMDYLLRDAYFCGTSYGDFDLGRLFRTFRIADNRLVVKESGVNAVEDYIMARYHMYWQVYFHPVSRSYEVVMQKLFKRLNYLYHHNLKILNDCQPFYPIFENQELSVEQHFKLDESTVNYIFNRLCDSSDPIVADLSSRIINRKLFKFVDSNEVNIDSLKSKLIENGYDLDYYYAEDQTAKGPYEPYSNDHINILLNNQTVVEIKDASVIVNSITKASIKKVQRIYYPK